MASLGKALSRASAYLGAVQTANGLPLAYRVWSSYPAETATLSSAIAEITERYPVRRMILVANPGS